MVQMSIWCVLMVREYGNLIEKSKNDLHLKLELFENQRSELSRHISEQQLKDAEFNHVISNIETDMATLNGKHEELSSDLNSLQVILTKKKHDEELIDQEIKDLEKRGELSKTDCDHALEEMNKKEFIRVELKEQESQIFSLVEKCKSLEEKLKETVSANPLDILETKMQNLEQLKLVNKETLSKVEAAKNQLNNKQQVEKTMIEESNCLKNKLNENLMRLENPIDGEQDLETLRKENEKLSLKINSCEEEVVEKDKVILHLQEYLQEQSEIYKELINAGIEEVDETNENERNELFDKYLSALEAMEKLQVDNINDSVNKVKAALQSNIEQKEEILESHRNEKEKMEQAHNLIVQDLEQQIKEHNKNCTDMLTKFDSEMNFVQEKMPGINGEIEARNEELVDHTPNLAQLVQSSLTLLEEMVKYYRRTCKEIQSSETTSIHWDHTKEVLQEILLRPIQKLSKLRGMSYIGALTASPQVYDTIIIQAKEMFTKIVNGKENNSAEYKCRRLIEMCHALFVQFDDSDFPFSQKLNDTVCSTSED